MSRCNAGEDVGRAGSRCHDDDGGFTGSARVAGCLERGRRFVARFDQASGRVPENGVEYRHYRTARYAEEGATAGIHESPDDVAGGFVRQTRHIVTLRRSGVRPSRMHRAVREHAARFVRLLFQHGGFASCPHAFSSRRRLAPWSLCRSMRPVAADAYGTALMWPPAIFQRPPSEIQTLVYRSIAEVGLPAISAVASILTLLMAPPGMARTRKSSGSSFVIFRAPDRCCCRSAAFVSSEPPSPVNSKSSAISSSSASTSAESCALQSRSSAARIVDSISAIP